MRTSLSMGLAAWFVAGCVALGLAGPVAARAQALPSEVESALLRAQVPPEALHVVVQELGGAVRLEHQASTPVNPASLAKLLTTYAALDLLGPAWQWRTPVWFTGPVVDGVLEGSLVLQGRGDPKLVLERVWLLLSRVRQLGVHEIRGDIVLERSAFAEPLAAPGDFDNEPYRPQNVQADALLLNHKTVQLSFVPQPGRGSALVLAEPALAGVQVDRQVPLSGGPCEDWRGALRATVHDARALRFLGSYPAACGERSWPLAYADPARYNARLIESMWRDLGGRLGGQVRDGLLPPQARLAFEFASPPLAEVVRDINKFSNNVMAQQLFLTLALQQRGSGTPAAAREVLRQWIEQRLGERTDGLVLDNGSGLSREARLNARLIARLLQHAWAAPLMPEFMASLPLAGTDGTLRRNGAASGRAHLKTGSLRDVAAVAGYVLGASGRRHLVVAIVQHPNAPAARPALDALVQWTLQDTVATSTLSRQ